MPKLLVDLHLPRRLRVGGGWPGFWGLQGPEYLAWLDEQPAVTTLWERTPTD